VAIVTSRVAPKLSPLKKIRKNLKMNQFLKAATAQIFRILHYASPVWLNKTLTLHLWTKLRSTHCRVLRAAIRDYKKRKHRVELDKVCKSATPQMWSHYLTTSTAMKIITDGVPEYLKAKLEGTMHPERQRPNHGKFYDSSKGKIGRHRPENWLERIDNLEWISNNSIRLMLKKHFNFNFD